MRGLGVITLAAALVGCNGNDDSDSDSEPTDGCPDGLSRTLNAGMVVSQLTLNGVDRFVGLSATSSYDGQPAVCRSADGTRAIWIFEQGNVAFGSLDVTAPSTGTVALNEAQVTLNLFGSPEGAVFSGASAWQQGVLEVQSVGNPLEVGITGGIGISPGGDQVTVTLSANAQSF